MADGSNKHHRPISEHEQRLWRYVTRDDVAYQPVDEATVVVDCDVDDYARQQARKRASLPAVIPTKSASQRMAPPLPIVVIGQMDGVDKNTAQRLKRGKLPIDCTVDLHGMNRLDAFDILADAVQRIHAGKGRVVHVITGKGRDGEGVIRQQLPLWLNAPSIRPYVLAVQESTLAHGGSGAFYVLLKRQRRS